MDAEPITVYATFPTPEDARRAAAALIGARLAACANIFPAGLSVYRWQGAVETASETYVLFKTVRARWVEVEAAIRAVHPYSVPCIVAWPIVAGHAAFLEWIAAESTSA